MIERAPPAGAPGPDRPSLADPCPPADRLVAVIGMGGVLPGAPDMAAFWRNILEGRSSVRQLPTEWFDSATLYDTDPDAIDSSYAQVGGIVEDIGFDARAFRIPPRTARAMDRIHRMALVAAVEAMRDAGYLDRPFDRDRAAVILGHAGTQTEKLAEVTRRAQQPLVDEALRDALRAEGVDAAAVEVAVAAARSWLLRGTDPVSEDSLPGLLPNVGAARVAGHFGMRGASYVVDSACASSLAAIDCAIQGLLTNEFDLAISGGIQACPWTHAMVGFSKFRGLSRTGVHPFDERADGFVPGEGAGLVVLKRLDHALRDGDRIRAVIRGVGGSSDGREKGIAAPNPRAQALAMRRALDAAGVSAATLQVIEAHGAGTPVGDPAELEAMAEAFGPDLLPGQRLLIGSVKSQLGHLFGAAGAAGLLKVLLGLEHQILPPTINHRNRTPRVDWSGLPFDVITDPAPWPANVAGLPRRAGVSAFGFGGVNYHLTLEAFDPAYHGTAALAGEAPDLAEPIAVIGLAAQIAPGGDAESFWQATLEGTTAITTPPASRYEGRADLFVDPDPRVEDKAYGELGAWLREDRFDPRLFRLPPVTAARLDPQHRWLLTLAHEAMHDAGCDTRPPDHQRTGVILGDSGGCQHTIWTESYRLSARRLETGLLSSGVLAATGLAPAACETLVARTVATVRGDRLPMTEECIMEGCAQIGAARYSKAAGLMGAHMVIDAACASVLAAVGVAMRALRLRQYDVVVTGGTSSEVTPMSAVAFAKASALSPTGCRPFRAEADGIIQGEGGAIFVLKRLTDALRDGDRIRAVIRGAGFSSDGGTRAMAAPDPEGQRLAFERAHRAAGYPPQTVDFIECHATGTPVGDAAELQAVAAVFDGPGRRPLAVSAVKGQVGHLGGGAGAAGLLRAIMALERGILPPAIGRGTPHNVLGKSPVLRLIDRPDRWPAIEPGRPRRAGVNGFGFGGTNCHLTLEAFEPAYHQILVGQAPASPVAVEPPPDEALLVVCGRDLAAAIATAEQLLVRIDAGESLRQVAADKPAPGPACLALAVGGADELRQGLVMVRKVLDSGGRLEALEARGIFVRPPETPAPAGRLAFLFPGQGSQYADMLRGLDAVFPVVGLTIAEADVVLRPLLQRGYREIAFRGRDETAEAVELRLMESAVVQPAQLVACVAMARLLSSLGLRADVVAGHSLGEYAALVSAGVLTFGEGLRLVHARGVAMDQLARSGSPGAMAMLATDPATVEAALRDGPGYVAIANRNCPSQTIIAGDVPAVERVQAHFAQRGIEGRMLPIAGAFHSRLATALRPPMEEALATLTVGPARCPVLSSVNGDYYPASPGAPLVRTRLLDQLDHPVDFVAMVERLHAEGVRTFIEVGPKRALSGFVADILGRRSYTAVHAAHPKPGELRQFHRLMGTLIARGWPMGQAPGAAPPQGSPAVPAVAARAGTPMTPTPAPRLLAEWTRAPGDDAVVVSGIGLGLPGLRFPVFDSGALERLFAGESLIDPLSEASQDRMLAHRVTRLVKGANGHSAFESVEDRSGVIKLAGQRGAFDLARDFGIADEYLLRAEPATQLAVAAGLEALRDAGIPLVRRYRRTTTGGTIPDGWVLPTAMQSETAVLFASAFPGHTTLAGELERFALHRYGALAADGLRHQYQERLAQAATPEERMAADRWFATAQARLWPSGSGTDAYQFDPHFLTRLVCMGNALMARLVSARGPNLHLNAACSSTTAALAVAEDMIRAGRAARVLVIAADDITSGPMLEWVGSGFLAAGASATDASVVDAAIPFDRRRHGMVMGMGAVGMVVERASEVRRRGVAEIAELLATRLGNIAGHLTRPDPEFIQAELDALLATVEQQHGLRRATLARQTLYLSHETFTHPDNGIGIAEVQALRETFGEAWKDLTVLNTKAMTGHAQAAGFEDAIALLSLQHRRVPPVINCRQPDPALDGIRLSTGGATDAEFALRFSAGFGGQVALSFARRGSRQASVVADPARYATWLATVAESPEAEVEVVHRTLRVRERAPEARPLTAPPLAPPVAAALPSAPPDLPLAVEPDQDAIAQAVLEVVADKTGYETELLELDLDLEADLGIDTIKQAQVMVSLRERFGLEVDPEFRLQEVRTLRRVVEYLAQRVGPASAMAVPAAAAAAPAPMPAATLPSPSAQTPGIEQAVLEIVSEKTGYETELLELDLDLEADLGIDTIKQAQVMVSLRERFGLEVDPEFRLQEVRTLRRVVEYLAQRVAPATAMTAPAAAAAPVPVPPPAPLGASAPSIEQAVLEIVSEKTGYETELLELDLDLEADLGIDTIKQAQVMVSLRERFGLEVDPDFRLQEVRTLRRIVAYLEERTVIAREAPASTTAEPAPAAASSLDAAPRTWRRLVPVAVEERSPRGPVNPLTTGTRVLVTADGLGVANALADLLRERGLPVAVIGPAVPAGVPLFRCRLDRPDELLAAVAAAKAALGGVEVLVHLAPLSAPPTGAPEGPEWAAMMATGVKSGFQLVRALRASVESGRILAATGMGGHFGFDPVPAPSVAVAGGGGAVAGLWKTVARELPDAHVRVVDLALEEAAARPVEAAQRLLAELESASGDIEVGYHGGRRFVARVREAREELPAAGPPTLNRHSTILIIGGGRGIGAAVARDLATRYQARMILVGRSPIPPESATVADQDAASRLAWRRTRHRQRRTEDPGLRPVLVEREIERIEAGAETLLTLRALQAAGARAEYSACDVCDPAGVRDVIREARAGGARLDLVVFGAGVIEDRLIADKDPASFDRVFDVKALGFHNLWQALKGAPPATLVVFSSIAGRFGNRGQSDYAAANDLLSRMTMAIARETPGLRAVAIDWTAWAEVGLAARSGSNALLLAAGVELLAPTVGARACHDEVYGGRVPSVCIVGRLGAMEPSGAGTGSNSHATPRGNGSANGHGNGNGHGQGLGNGHGGPVAGERPKPANKPLGYIDTVHALVPGVEVRAACRLDASRLPWLGDHVIDGQTLLPGVMGIELMAEAAGLLYPDWAVSGVDAVEISRGVKFFAGRPVELGLTGRVEPSDDPAERRVAMRLTSDFSSPDGRIRQPDRQHYAATIILREARPTPGGPPGPDGAAEAIIGSDALYGPVGLLPHGPAFRVLHELRLTPEGATGRLAPIDIRDLAAPDAAPLRTTPLITEAAFQAAGLLGLLRLTWPGLPASIAKLRFFGPAPAGPGLLARARIAGETDGVPEFDVVVTDADGRVVQLVQGFRLVGLSHHVAAGS